MKLIEFSKISEKDYVEIGNILKSNGIILYPTETIYGIGGKAFEKEVVKKIVLLKKRDIAKQFILLFKDLSMLEKFVEISPLEREIINKYWPGKLTIILKSKNNDEELACRISSHPFIVKLFDYIDFPLISTSANISNEEYSGKINDILKKFKNKVDVFISDKDLTNNIPSTIIKIVNGEISILRQGVLKIE